MPVIENGPTIALDHIMIATDFSPASEAAVTYAAALARRFSSRLTVTNVIDLSVATRSDAAVVGLPIDRLRHESAENMDRTLSQLLGSGLQVDGKTVEAHQPAAAVVRLALDNTDLLVLGAHGRAGLEKLIGGSFAEGAIHHAKCPVLTIGPNVKPAQVDRLSFKNILFATDLHHQTSEKVAIALAFAHDSIAQVYLCHVIEHPKSSLADALDQEFKTETALREMIPDAVYEWCSPEVGVDFGKPAERILQLAEKTEADLIILGARRSATWFAHFAPGVTGRVIAKAKCPVMTICAD